MHRASRWSRMGMVAQAESRQKFNLDISCFERLVRTGGFPVTTLQVQRRMRPSISRLIRVPIYPKLQVCGPTCAQLKRIPTVPALKWTSATTFCLCCAAANDWRVTMAPGSQSHHQLEMTLLVSCRTIAVSRSIPGCEACRNRYSSGTMTNPKAVMVTISPSTVMRKRAWLTSLPSTLCSRATGTFGL